MKALRLSLAALALTTLSAGAVMAQAPANDACAGAIDISSSFGQAVNTVVTIGPYDNTNATHHSTDPTVGYECFGDPDGNGTNPSLENTLWFSFVGDGNLYLIETGQCTPALPNSQYIDFGDTQMAIYTGTCGSLVPEACNEDGPSTTSNTYPAGITIGTTAGTTYYVMIDGYLDGTTPSVGQFCLKIKQLPTIACNAASVSAGTATAPAAFLCFGDSLNLSATGIQSPTVGSRFGFSWVITTAPISGAANPLTQTSLVASYRVQSPAPATTTLEVKNDGTFIGSTATLPYGTYYWTPVVFGNAQVSDPNSPFLSGLFLDSTCTTVGTSVMIDMRPQNSPNCTVGRTEFNKSGFGISDMYPVPVQQTLRFTLRADYSADVVISVKDVLGREVLRKQQHANAGENQVTLNLDNQAGGVYVITVGNDRHVAVSKFVKE